jgi:hypothetical protein
MYVKTVMAGNMFNTLQLIKFSIQEVPPSNNNIEYFNMHVEQEGI